MGLLLLARNRKINIIFEATEYSQAQKPPQPNFRPKEVLS